MKKRDDGKFEVLDVKLDNRKTKSLDPKNSKVLENNKIDLIKENNNSSKNSIENFMKSNSKITDKT